MPLLESQKRSAGESQEGRNYGNDTCYRGHLLMPFNSLFNGEVSNDDNGHNRYCKGHSKKDLSEIHSNLLELLLPKLLSNDLRKISEGLVLLKRVDGEEGQIWASIENDSSSVLRGCFES